MNPIVEPRITKTNGKFVATCKCGKVNAYSSKDRALRMLKNEVCRYCRPHYKNVENTEIPIYKREDGKWCCVCSGCNIEQAYTRKDHAKQSYLNDWQCKKCVGFAKGFNNNKTVGDKTRVFRRFQKSAVSRGIDWDLTEEQMYEGFDGFCSMTGWAISLSYLDSSASLDRVDNEKGYIVGNIQWVHKMVNMMKNKYSQEDFIKVCKAVAVKW